MMRTLFAVLFLLPVSLAQSPPKPSPSIKLYVLDAKAEEHLGKRVTFDAILAKSPLTNGNLNLLTTEGKTPVDLVFKLPPKLAEVVTAVSAGVEQSVFITGSVVARARANAPYGVDVEEIRVYGPKGDLLKTINLTTAVEKKPGEETAALKKPVNDGASETPANGDDLPVGSMIAGGLAVGVGAVVLVLLFRKKKPTANEPPPPPSTSVSDRLNRRVR